jgi:hypothetical protein
MNPAERRKRRKHRQSFGLFPVHLGDGESGSPGGRYRCCCDRREGRRIVHDKSVLLPAKNQRGADKSFGAAGTSAIGCRELLNRSQAHSWP